MHKQRQLMTAFTNVFRRQPDGRAEHPPLPTAATSPPSGSELLVMLEIVGDRWHCPRSGHEDLRTWLWNLQLTLSEVELAAQDDLETVLQIQKQLLQPPTE